MRLYLHDGQRYRVRSFTGYVTLCFWDGVAGAFVTGRGQQTRLLLEKVAAVATVHHAAIHKARWHALDDCFKAKHQPVPKGVAWVHPYARKAA